MGENAAGAAGPGATVAVGGGAESPYLAAFDDAPVYDPEPDAAAGLGVGFTAVPRLLATSPSRLQAVTGVALGAAGDAVGVGVGPTGAAGATAGATAGAANRGIGRLGEMTAKLRQHHCMHARLHGAWQASHR